MGSKILVVDDNQQYLRNLQRILETANYEVDIAEDAISAIEMLGESSYVLIISDLKMEVMDGNRFLSFVKKMYPEIRTVLLTGDPDPASQITAITNDVDQYLDKSLHADVLLKYIEKLLVREITARKERLVSVVEDLVVDMRERTVTVRGERVELTTREFNVLALLLKEKGKAIHRQEFIDELWDKKFEDVDLRVVDIHIKFIRKKTRVSSIVAIRGHGYKWDE